MIYNTLKKALWKLSKKERQNVERDLKELQTELWDIQTLLLGDRDNALYKIARTRYEKIPMLK